MNSRKMWIRLFCFAWFTLMISPAFSETASSGEIATGSTEPVFHKVIFAPGYQDPAAATPMSNSQGYLRIILDFTKLPTQQGWGYFLVGNYWPEASVFTIGGSGNRNWLHQDSMQVKSGTHYSQKAYVPRRADSAPVYPTTAPPGPTQGFTWNPF